MEDFLALLGLCYLFSFSLEMLRIVLISEGLSKFLVALLSISYAHLTWGSQQRADFRLLQSKRQINYGSICSSSAPASRGACHVRMSCTLGRVHFSSFRTMQRRAEWQRGVSRNAQAAFAQQGGCFGAV